ncbi:hypothetical protein [Nocardioides rubriscoriae]|uniref:hypothetical protein n=1 Tax=Nocardioides rubriscoriae TaxID=642762 RepID=UPI0011DF6C3F|nr:hypothetical protein [Nocardioides rubriscoriae]
MPGLQRILVVSDGVGETELERVRHGLGRDPVVLTAPTPEAARVVRTLGAEPRVELSLAAVRFPAADRGHQLDALVRSHALGDRFRDVVVVTDQATSTLLLRVLAPDQLATGGAVQVVGLPRADRPVAARRAVVAGVVLGGVAGVLGAPVLLLVLIGLLAPVGLVLTLTEPRRHLGHELLLAAAVALAVSFVVVASSARFPGAF